ncbi:MAG: DUF5661 family protein [Planctomycetota bacterium]|jgi:hypothetical protein
MFESTIGGLIKKSNDVCFIECQIGKGNVMKIPEYITVQEVQRVCKQLKIRDWTKLKKAEVPLKEARIILAQIKAGNTKIEVEEFRKGLEVELEHGVVFKDANVTNNHPVLTGKIVLAHFKESLDYYRRLEVSELEGDLFKAVNANNSAKVKALYKKLANAKLALSKAEARQLG